MRNGRAKPLRQADGRKNGEMTHNCVEIYLQEERNLETEL